MPYPYSENSPPAAQAAAPRIDAVLFDYGQVLSLPPDAGAWAKICSIAGVDEDRFRAAYWAFRHDYDRGALTGTTYWHAVAERTSTSFDDSRIAALNAADVDLWTNLNQPMVDWAARLQRAGVRTGILSNIGDSIADGIIARLPWLAGFYHCVWSHSLFMAKPEAAIYLKTAEALHTAPANILFIDDREDNIAAAAALGFPAIVYTTHSAFEHSMRARGFASLLDIGTRTGDPAPSIQTTPAPAPAAK